MWGFLTCLNDILVPHLKSIFDLSYAQVMLVQFAFFSAYFLFSVPWSKVVNTIGYQKTMVAGLLTMACGAFLFVPAASAVSYPLFLTALLVLAAGITGLQVSANPYVDLLGKPETASSRLDLTQAFNSLGTTIAPKIGGLLILSAAPLAIEKLQQLSPEALHAYRVQQAASVKMPYTVISIALVLLAVLIGTFTLPKIEAEKPGTGENVNDSIWKHPNLILGAIGIFAYVGAEVSIGSFLVNYFSLPEIAGPVREVRSRFCFLLLGWHHDRTLCRCRTSTADQSWLPAGSMRNLCRNFGNRLDADGRAHGDVEYSRRGILQLDYVPHNLQPGRGRTGSFNRECFRRPEHGNRGRRNPTCGPGHHRGSSGIHHAFFLPVLCYLYILFYGLSGSKPNSERFGRSSAETIHVSRSC
jgi:FHS family L-fucose permease-like MFS transporter